VGNVPLADRATIGNMSPEYGSTCAIFPIDSETLRYLEFSGRPREQVELVEAYAREQGLWHEPDDDPTYSDTMELDLGDVEPSLAGPRRPQDRVALSEAQQRFREVVTEHADLDFEDEAVAGTFPASDPISFEEPGNGHGLPPSTEPAHPAAAVADPNTRTSVPVTVDGETFNIDHGDVVIAAITSCTNTSNPDVMIGAGLLARNAVQRGLEVKPWVKTSLAPGSKVVMEYYEKAGLIPYLEALRFHLVGYGCTTCIGNSGPLPEEISAAVEEGDLAVVSVLSGNRNFEGRINPDVKMNYLASPPLVVAYALAGTMDLDLVNDPLGEGQDGESVYLRDIWPASEEVARVVEESLHSDMFRSSYREVFAGDERWHSLDVPEGDRFAWDPDSTYVREPPYFKDLPRQPEPIADIRGARVLAKLGDSVTTDHISPAGAIKKQSPAGAYLIEHGVERRDFNSYGSRRGNHEVMMRGTFANIRLRNQLAPGTEGGVTRHLPSGEVMTIFDASNRYAEEGVPLVVLAGTEYGSGSSRDWAAKGTRLLGVRAVIAESFERIHRSNLVGMGVLPLQLSGGDTIESLGLTGEEEFSIEGLAGVEEVPRELTVQAGDKQLTVRVRIDTPKEQQYYRHGGILPFVLRSLLDAD
jgi:aconitate hydratase